MKSAKTQKTLLISLLITVTVFVVVVVLSLLNPVVSSRHTGEVTMIDTQDGSVISAPPTETPTPEPSQTPTAVPREPISIENIAELALLEEIPAHAHHIYIVEFSPDGSLFASSSSNGVADNITKLWDVTAFEEVHSLPLSFRENSFVDIHFFSNERIYVARALDDSKVGIWELKSGERIGTVEGYLFLRSNVFSPDGNYIVTSTYLPDGEVIQMWDLKTFSHVQTFTFDWQLDPPDPQYADTYFTVLFSPSGTEFVSALTNGRVLVWDVETGEQLQELSGDAGINYSVDGSMLAVRKDRYQIQVWDTASWEVMFTLDEINNEVISSIAFSPDGTLLAAATSAGHIFLWDVAGQEYLRTLDMDVPYGDAKVVFSPTGEYLVFYGSRDGLIYFWGIP